MSLTLRIVRSPGGMTMISLLVAVGILMMSLLSISAGVRYALNVQARAEAAGRLYDLESFISAKIDCPTTVANLGACTGEVIPLWKARTPTCQSLGSLQGDGSMILGSFRFRARCLSYDSTLNRYQIVLELQNASGAWESTRPSSNNPRNLYCSGKEISFRTGWQAGMYLWGTGRLVGANLPNPLQDVAMRRDHRPTYQALCNFFGRVPGNTPGYESDGRFSTPHDDFLTWYNPATSTWTKTPAVDPQVNNQLWEGYTNSSIALRCVLPSAKRCP